MRRREFITLLRGAAVAVVTVRLVVAGQDYPTRSVTLIVNFPPGGSTDAMARIIREPLSQALGQGIIIANRGGARGSARAGGGPARLTARPTPPLTPHTPPTPDPRTPQNPPLRPETAR